MFSTVIVFSYQISQVAPFSEMTQPSALHFAGQNQRMIAVGSNFPLLAPVRLNYGGVCFVTQGQTGGAGFATQPAADGVWEGEFSFALVCFSSAL